VAFASLHSPHKAVSAPASQTESYTGSSPISPLASLASLGLGWVGEPAVEALLHPLFVSLALSEKASGTISILTGFIILSSLHIVVGEQVPKTFAIRKPEPVSLWSAYPLETFYLLTYPLN
jgi:CBS domain containing-hemolysin-like protein